MKLKLHAAWSQRLKLMAESDKLRAEGSKLRAEGSKLWAEGNKLMAESDKLRAEGSKLRAEGSKLRAEGAKLRAEGDKLRAEGDKLRAEGNKLWAEAILAAYGNITLSWTWETEHGECTLENGDRYAELHTRGRAMTLKEIAEELRKHYPDAVSVRLFVNATEHEVEVVAHRNVSWSEYGATYKCLDGQWAHKRSDT